MSLFFSIRGFLSLIALFTSVILALRNPKYGLMAFAVLLFARAGLLIYEFPILYELHFPLFFAILTCVSYILQMKRHRFRFPVQMWFMVFYMLAIFASRLLNPEFGFSHKAVAEYPKMLMLGFLVVNTLRNKRDVKQFLWLLVVVNLSMLLYQYYHYRQGSVSIFIYSQIRGLNRNSFAAILCSNASLVYGFIRIEKGAVKKIFLTFALLAFISGVILTYSRGGAVTLAATIITAVLMDRRKLKPAILILLALLVIGIRVSDKYYNRLDSISDFEMDPSAMGRVATNMAAINMIKEKPFLGFGAGNYPDAFLYYLPVEMWMWVAPGKNIHNIILQVASETGLIGLLFFLSFIFRSFWDNFYFRRLCFKNGFIDDGYLLLGVGVAFFSFFFAMQFGQGAYWGYLHLFLPLSIVAVEVIREEHIEKKEA